MMKLSVKNNSLINSTVLTPPEERDESEASQINGRVSGYGAGYGPCNHE